MLMSKNAGPGRATQNSAKVDLIIFSERSSKNASENSIHVGGPRSVEGRSGLWDGGAFAFKMQASLVGKRTLGHCAKGGHAIILGIQNDEGSG